MRECESCKACCSLLGFETKPDDFQCEWLKGFLQEDSRPDKLGLLFTMEESRTSLERRTLVSREFIPGSFQVNQEVLSSLSKRKLIVLQKKYSHDYIGPINDIETVKRLGGRGRLQ